MHQVINELRRSLQIEGIDVECNGATIKVGGLITSWILDIKERDKVLLMNGGHYRCPHCYDHGVTIPPHPSVCFPYQDEKPKLRSKQSFLLDAAIGIIFCII